MRDPRYARRWLWPIAWLLAANEARTLRCLAGVRDVPQLVHWGGGVLIRTWIEGRPLVEGAPPDPRYYASAVRLLATLHRRGVAHNDTAKQPNWLVTPDGRAALIDFQMATLHRRGSPVLRWLAREDLRHMLKHKRVFFATRLTARQNRIVDSRSWPHRLNLALWKPVYNFVTRRLLRWRDREGGLDRNFLKERDALPAPATTPDEAR